MRKPPPVLERVIEAASVDYAKGRGWLSRKMNGLGFRSWPDRYFLPPERSKFRPFWVEFKRSGEVPTPDQTRIHRTLRRRGELVFVVDDRAEFRRLLARLER